MKLIVLRHAESVWNAEGRISGQSADAPGLSEAGHAGARQLGSEIACGSEVERVWCSDAVRAVETADQIARCCRAPLRQTAALREVRAGILEGLTHDDAARAYPAAYQTWRARGDLDSIPGAETGEQLQARAIAFIALVETSRPAGSLGSEVAVTHAAFLRCLVNTVIGRTRSAPVRVGHCDQNVLTDPWQRLAPAACGVRWRNPVFRVRTADGDYVVKKVDSAAEPAAVTARMSLGNMLARAVGSPVPVDIACTDDDRAGHITVRRYIEGTHLLGHLGRREESCLLALLGGISEALTRLTATGRAAELPPLTERVQRYARGTGHGAAGLREILADSSALRRLNTNETVADLDLHRHNILFHRAGVVKIDFDGLYTGPREMQAAAAIVGGFLLYQDCDVQRVIKAVSARCWASQDIGSLTMLLRVRALLGLAYFEKIRTEYASAGGAISAEIDDHIQRHLDCLRRIERISPLGAGRHQNAARRR